MTAANIGQVSSNMTAVNMVKLAATTANNSLMAQ